MRKFILLVIGLAFGILIYLPLNLSYREADLQPAAKAVRAAPTLSDSLKVKLADLFPPLSDCSPLPLSKAEAGSRQSMVNRSIRMAARYLESFCNEEGQFLYRVNLNPGVRPDERYNLLRHAGSIYVLAKYYRQSNDHAALSAVENALVFLKKQSLDPIPEHPELQGIWSYPRVTSGKAPAVVKLGGTGLGLIALAEYGEAFPQKCDLKQLAAMGDFLLFMQKESGEFYTRYVDKLGSDDRHSSLYYPGEAILGLTHLFKIYPSQKWLDGAIRGLLYLAHSRAALTHLPADNWALIATAELLQIDNQALTEDIRRDIISHAIRIVQGILDEKPVDVPEPRLAGSLTHGGETTPTATRLEGLLAALQIVPGDEVTLRQKMLEAIHQGICFLQNTQIQSGPYKGGFTRECRPFSAAVNTRGSHFNPLAAEIRIDYVQHALNAMLEYRQLFASTPTDFQ